ncbi:MAG TPA: septation protein SepH, partial [Mycobacteriales bacterium]|nr:septation protein SepH [Mycobacteriales bacterium]
MRQLKFVSLTEDGANVVLEAGQGELFLLPIDERLRAAARGDITRLGQIEIELENPLRPRDIQARIRAGESAEQLAAASRMPLDRVLRFAYPVLQEREQVTAEARRSRLRRSDGGAQRTLGELVDERLTGRGVAPESTAWDSWRRDDGGWTVVARWREPGGSYVATWAFDLSTRSATPADETAADLVAEHPQRVRGVTPVTPLAVAAA